LKILLIWIIRIIRKKSLIWTIRIFGQRINRGRVPGLGLGVAIFPERDSAAATWWYKPYCIVPGNVAAKAAACQQVLQPPLNGSTGEVPVLEPTTFSRTLVNFLKDCPRNTPYMHEVFLGQSLRKFHVPGRGPHLLNRCEVAAESSLLTCSRLCSHISWYNTTWFLPPCGRSWIAFWKNSHLVNRDDPKIEGPFGEKIAPKSKNSCQMNGRSCGCIGTVDSGPKCAHSWNQIQTLKECLFVISIALKCKHIWARFLRPLAQSLIGSPGTLRGGEI